MRFPPSFLDELKARLPVSEVVGKRVKLKKAGREWKGLSPFQQEKTPSFTVNDQKQFYHDFSTDKHGNIFDFVMETEGVSFPEAVERLASLAGLPLPRVSREDEQREERQKSLHDVMELAAKYFEQNLASNIGPHARGYLADRGIVPSTSLEFRLGYATPNRFGLKEYLGSKGVSVSDMIETGLLIAGDDIPVPYDRFRDRVIIPIHDQRGRVIAFGGPPFFTKDRSFLISIALESHLTRLARWWPLKATWTLSPFIRPASKASLQRWELPLRKSKLRRSGDCPLSR
jgi:DNA primase